MISTLDNHSVASQNEWSLGAGASKMVACNSPHDDITTYITTVGPDKEQLFYTESLPGGSINVTNVDHTIRFIRYAGAGGDLYHRQRYGGTSQYCSSAHDVGAWTTYTDSAVSRPGGGSWAVSDFNQSAEFGVATIGDAPGDGWRTTSTYVLVTHQLSSGGYSWILANWIPPLLPWVGGALSLLDVMSACREFLYPVKSKPSSEEDYRRILEWLQCRRVTVEHHLSPALALPE
jgi:hypothetical protein